MSAVTVWESGARRRTLADVESAARFLLEKWPEEHQGTAPYRIAAEDALRLLEHPELPVWPFRGLFVWAAESAGVLATEDAVLKVRLAPHVARPWDLRKTRRGQPRRSS